MWLQPKSAHASSSLLNKWGNSGFIIALISLIKVLKPKFLDEKLPTGVFSVPIS